MKHNLYKDKDVIFSTIFVFAFIGLIKFSLVHIPHIDPITAALEDFEITDIVYQWVRDKNTGDVNSPVVVVDIGDNREEIAQQIEVINSFGPKVIAVDAFFLTPREAESDSMLISAMGKVKNLVVGSYLESTAGQDAHGGHGEEGELRLVQSFAPIRDMGHTAFVNFIGEENKTIRLFKPQIEVEGKTVNSFSAEIVRLADNEKYKHLLARNKKTEYINYTKSGEQYVPVIEAEDIHPDNEALGFLKDKIVIIGANSFTSLDDLHFTPLNARMAGRSKPDMPGVFIHANTVEMILSDNYVNKIPDWVVLLFSVLITYLSIIFYTRYYVENHIWYHLVAKLSQFAFIVLFVFLEIFLLRNFNLRFSDKIIMVPIVLSVDLLYFYDAFVKWLHKRFGYHTYFLKGHS